jgi:hypothetical protein
MFSEEQLAAYNAMKEYVTTKEHEFAMILLEGYAGTGKTFVMSKFIKYLVLMLHKSVAVTAPTNKAVKVAKKMANYKHQLIRYKTLHSLLGLKEVIDERTGKRSFQPSRNPEDEPAITEVDVLIIDETSMMPDDLLELVTEHLPRLKVIFIGDPVQIPPVNKADTKVFIAKERENLRIGRYVLTQVRRQALDSPILNLATIIRGHYKSPSLPYELKTEIVEGSGIVALARKDKNVTLDICRHYFDNDVFRDDADFMKVIAWTNKVVDKMNDYIRPMIFKDQDLTKVMIGEKLVADEPIVDNTGVHKVIQYTTHDEFEVEAYRLDQIQLFGREEFTIKFYETKVWSYDENGHKRSKFIKIVHEDGEEAYNELEAYLKKQAKQPGLEKWEWAARWRQYYDSVGMFAKVKYNYAITAHKSQGSTYENTMVIDSDISENPRIEERNRIRYVCFTRAKKLLFIVK